MRVVTSLYLVILAYIIAALVFWEMSLQQQSGRIYAQEVITLRTQLDSMQFPREYAAEMHQLNEKLDSRTTQYVAEGITFLVVILIGAAVVYGSFSRRISLSRQQNNFMLAVTHELKSPLASIKLNLQTLEKHQLDDEKRRKLIDRCISESNRLNDLCNNMLFTSQIEGGQYKPVLEAFSLSDMAEDVVAEFAARYQRTFEEDISEGCRIIGDKSMLRIAVTNLVENAIKYTPATGVIKLSLEMRQQTAILQVADKGPGIPDAEKKKVFDKFYRVGNEESRKTKGTGLGLYLSSRIVAQHRGRMLIKDNAPTGSIFEIQLPVLQNRP
ncbi:HAMP domain-containing sensor histidine kinase [Nemorincola caseinilytica]|uniref:histidine kinase n=1 Tax=Nemorincola caseinilytica TaxID=2054315 RepID=A0ABP8NA71_9BACT